MVNLSCQYDLIIIQIQGRVLGHDHADYSDTMYHLGTVHFKALGHTVASIGVLCYTF